MEDSKGRAYYTARKPQILQQFDTHAGAWRGFLVASYGEAFADAVLQDTRQQYEAVIPTIPYLGGDENPMTRHLVRSTTSLVLYQVMRSRGKSAIEVGKIVHDAVAASVSQMPVHPFWKLSPERVAKEKEQARRSQECRYPGDWVWAYVEGDGVAFDYGRDYVECGTHKLYHAHGADEFLPFYCYLDFVTHRTAGWGFARTMTLGEGHDRCDFRWKVGGETRRGWPPPFVRERHDKTDP